jgi:hypothetical protein
LGNVESHVPFTRPTESDLHFIGSSAGAVAQWLTPVILTTWKPDSGSWFQTSLGKNDLKNLTSIEKIWA